MLMVKINLVLITYLETISHCLDPINLIYSAGTEPKMTTPFLVDKFYRAVALKRLRKSYFWKKECLSAS